MLASPDNMNTMNNSVYSELTARTQFVLDRIAFLKDVGLTLMDEGKPVADAKIDVWLSNAYIPLIVRCITSAENEAVRNEALWAVANLLGSDADAVREATKAALTSDLLKMVLDYVFTDSKDTVGCAAFLLSNYARFKNISYTEAQSIAYAACAKGIITNGKTATDLLWAANYAGEKFPAAIPLSLVVNTLGDASLSQKKASSLLRLLGIAAEQDGLVHANLLEPTFGVLESLLANTNMTSARAEMFWILSNILTEPGAPEIFFSHKSLLQATIDAGSNGGLQATYVLANFVTLVKDPVIQESLARGANSYDEHGYAFDIYDHFSQLSFNENTTRRALGVEGLNTLFRYVEIYYPASESIEDMDLDSECDDECAVHLARTEENIAPNDDDACKNEWNTRVPCAYELLYGSDRASCESSVVRYLVGLVEHAMSDPTVEGDGWVKVPLDTVVSVGDLVTLQHMGYIFDGEWLGVNPAIYSGY